LRMGPNSFSKNAFHLIAPEIGSFQGEMSHTACLAARGFSYCGCFEAPENPPA
jgi:hypothetical protein